jgi:uncharacterized protein YjbJ (UPF0337 family)
MSGKSDQVKGRAKEVVGTITGNKDLESEGKVDRQVGGVKQAIAHTSGKIEEFIEKAEEEVTKTIKRFEDGET